MFKQTTINRAYIVVGCLLLIFYIYIYNYMYFCTWDFKDDLLNNQSNSSSKRVDSIEHLIMLGDPQMEGDWRIKTQGKKGEYNIWFNDNYFKHIVSNIAYYLRPGYLFTLGDLFSSQHCNDGEFVNRVQRYKRIFSPLDKYLGEGQYQMYNITGNHDIGYAHEASPKKVDRFEESFGKVNDKFFINGHLIGIVNSINLDRSKHEQLYNDSWQHLRDLKELKEQTGSPLILITHIPLHKQYNSDEEVLQETIIQEETRDIQLGKRGQKRNQNNMVNDQILFPNGHPKYKSMCTETYFIISTDDGFVKEQSMLTKETSQYILDELKPLFIFNGHDHDGCIFKHSNNYTTEYTIRSMMGDFGGYTGLFEIKKSIQSNLSVRNTEQDQPIPSELVTYEYNFKACPFIETKYINISFGVTAGYIVSFFFYRILLYVIEKVQKKKWKVKLD
ncbi:hypothetical protein DLAC_03395 [Tieghemostelium lacteum]|uniref:Calcineurin-like phosphoesterase domain-containing protein n=1 Tax=Tieghemostelium lacteum TaxID=361077 RepID=A0A152A1Y6_TIELA|nr:hypothetical protein DLAC_03395 [Tieghemostelium lacteum]|eukprot:KYR00236.1 hypothetical protein DLAC_03395 [Tieghemostelium lacteum]